MAEENTINQNPNSSESTSSYEDSISDSKFLNQEEIDSLLGYGNNLVQDSSFQKTGVRAILNSSMVSYERLPMLEIVFDRLVRLMATSLRNFTQDNVEVSLDSIESMRFGEYIESLTLPTLLNVCLSRGHKGFTD